MLFPLGLGLLTSAFPVLLAIYFNVVPYALQFPLFVFSIISVALSVVLVALHFIYTWPTKEPWRTYPYRSFERSLERSESRETDRINPEKAEALKVVAPTREELQRLKEVLGLSRGSLQFKKRGQGIYLVTYEHGKHVWKHLGQWNQLKEKLPQEISSN